MQKKRWKDSKSPSSGSKEEPSSHNGADAYMNSELTACARPEHMQARQNLQCGEGELGT